MSLFPSSFFSLLSRFSLLYALSPMPLFVFGGLAVVIWRLVGLIWWLRSSCMVVMWVWFGGSVASGSDFVVSWWCRLFLLVVFEVDGGGLEDMFADEGFEDEQRTVRPSMGVLMALESENSARWQGLGAGESVWMKHCEVARGDGVQGSTL